MEDRRLSTLDRISGQNTATAQSLDWLKITPILPTWITSTITSMTNSILPCITPISRAPPATVKLHPNQVTLKEDATTRPRRATQTESRVSTPTTTQIRCQALKQTSRMTRQHYKASQHMMRQATTTMPAYTKTGRAPKKNLRTLAGHSRGLKNSPMPPPRQLFLKITSTPIGLCKLPRRTLLTSNFNSRTLPHSWLVLKTTRPTPTSTTTMTKLIVSSTTHTILKLLKPLTLSQMSLSPGKPPNPMQPMP